MAARTRRRRPRTVQEGLVGKEEYRVLDPSGTHVATKGYRPLALVKAQTLAQRADEGARFTVERRSLFGPPTVLYRVFVDEDGAVVTHTVNQDD